MTASAPDLTVLVVSFQCRDVLGPCLRSVRSTAVRHDVRVVVVDNASTDGSLAVAAEADPLGVHVAMGGNPGFAVANNRALQGADGRYVLLLNPDTEVGPGALDGLIDLLDTRPEAGVVAPALVYPDGTPQRTARAFPTPAAAFWGRRSVLTRAFPGNRWSRRYLIPQVGTAPYAVDWVSGACLMMRRALLVELGGLDEGFFMHWEDADLCRRVRDRGLQVLCDPSLTVVHAEGVSRQGWPPSQIAHFHRGAYRYWSKHQLTGARRVLRPVVAAALGARALLLVLGQRLRTVPVTAQPAAHALELSA